eukprot:8093262-Pyramimonas_sp.AAC.1
MSPPFKLEHYKHLMRLAASEVRDSLFTDNPDSLDTLLQVARMISRVVWRQDVKLALRMLESHPRVRDHITVRSSEVALIHPSSFSEWASSIQRQAAE